MRITKEEIHNLVLTNGKRYVSALLPSDLKRMPVGHCFDNCALLCLLSKGKYKYAEGLAMNPITKEWMPHAWLTDGIHAFDPTWQAFDDNNVEYPFPGNYTGIEMPIEEVCNFMTRTKYAGVLMNAWRFPELAGKII